MFRTAIGALACLTLLLPLPAALAQDCDQHHATDDTKAEVPALSEFHEVIYPLWHNAWPNKDFDMMKELLPQVREHVAEVQQAELPGILREKKTAWAEGVERLTATLALYEQAAEGDDQQALLDAVEKIHSDFESLIRLIRPPMRELDAYHQVLYRIYHYYAPQKQVEELRQASGELTSACDALSQAPAPRRHADKAGQLATEVEDLCTRTALLQEVTAGSEWEPIAEAVEQVHTQYMAVQGIFE
jgi:hypothetical protein